MNNQKVLKILVILIIVTVLVLIIINVIKYFKNKNLIQYPLEILEHEVDGVIYKSNIDKIKVEKTETKLDKQTQYCEIHLRDEKYNRVLYICIVSKYKGNGNWELEDWHEYKEGTVKER